MKSSFLYWIVFGAITALFAQDLDWSGDQILFGSPSDETSPCIVIEPAGTLRALCIRDDSTALCKISSNGGQSWGQSFEYSEGLAASRISSCTDGLFSYQLLWAEGGFKRVFRNVFAQADWRSAHSIDIAPDQRQTILAAAIASDSEIEPDDPYLNVCWITADSIPDYVSVWFAQSRDQASSFRSTVRVASGLPACLGRTQIGVSAVRMGDGERLVVVTAVERAGSPPDAICIFASDDQGDSWSEGLLPDMSSAEQYEPSICAIGENVIVAYSRRPVLEQPSDIYLTYSSDGGQTFTPPAAAAFSEWNEIGPRLIANSADSSFMLFFTAGVSDSLNGTLFMKQGRFDSPWLLSSAVQISETDGIIVDGECSAFAGSIGTAAVWTGRFILGDSDIHFDGSWRAAEARNPPGLAPTSYWIGECFPNPFNSTTILPIELQRPMQLRIVISDILGRRVLGIEPVMLSSGSRQILLDLSQLPSGIYFASIPQVPVSPRKLLLIR